MLPIPRHLNDILIPIGEKNNENHVEGAIRCSCGCECFELKIYADTKDGNPQVCQYNDNWTLVVKAICKGCGKNHLIFDASKHGWDGFVCHDSISVLDDELKSWNCQKCKSSIHKVKCEIMSQGKQDFIEQSGITTGENEFSEDDWVEAFEWITIGLSCCKCGYVNGAWIDYETT